LIATKALAISSTTSGENRISLPSDFDGPISLSNLSTQGAVGGRQLKITTGDQIDSRVTADLADQGATAGGPLGHLFVEAERPEVADVLHPALPGGPDHVLWQRDFSGSNGLFGVILNPPPEGGMKRFFSALSLFSLGFSWGGFESLIIPCDQQLTRMKGSWTETRAGPLLRLHIGLEATRDLKADLDAAFRALSAV
jgi:hypothetical protein